MQKADKFFPVSKPEISAETISELVETIKSGWLATGPKTQKFEDELSDYFNHRCSLTVTSNTVGLYSALRALNIGPGDCVVTTPLTFVATVNAIELVGATPLFVDIDRATFNLDVNRLFDLNNDKIKAVIPVHYAGLPVDMDPLIDIAKQNNWRIIEDAAHAMGSVYKGQKIGTFGDIQVFSFHPIKNMTTGEGGCIVSKSTDVEFSKAVELIRFHGIDRSMWDRFSNTNSRQMYDVVLPGFKFNMSDIQSVIGLHQLKEVEKLNEKRRAIIGRYRDNLQDCSGLKMQEVPAYSHVHSGHLFPLVVSDIDTRDALAKYLKEWHIGSTPYYYPVHLFSYYANKYGYKIGDYPNAEYVGMRSLCIPLYPSLTEEEQMYVIKHIQLALR